MIQIKLQIVFIFLLMTFFLLTLGIASVPEDNMQNQDSLSSPVIHYFYLYPVQDALPLYLYPNMDEKEVEFKKEPDLGKGKIYRKLLPLGRDEKDHIPFAWNVKTAKLYLDFNRNFDLTDDPDNMFDATEKNKWKQKFSHIPIVRQMDISQKKSPFILRFMHNEPVHPSLYLIDLNLFYYEKLSAYIQVNSSWKGEIDLPDIRAQMIVTDNMDGHITTPEESNGHSPDIYKLASIIVNDSSTTATYDFIKSCKIPDKLHIQNHSYIMKYDFKKEFDRIVLRVGFQETKPDMGTIRIQGTHIKNLKIEGDFQVHLFSPGEKMMIPSGIYKEAESILETANGSQGFHGFSGNGFTLEKNGEYELKIGAPLKNTVTINHFRKQLVIIHSLTGIGNEEYVLLNEDIPPEFEIYKGNKRIFTDKFKFG